MTDPVPAEAAHPYCVEHDQPLEWCPHAVLAELDGLRKALRRAEDLLAERDRQLDRAEARIATLETT